MLDTSVCVRALRQRSGDMARRFKERPADLFISTLAVTELLFGAAVSSRPAHHSDQVGELIRRLTVLDFDEDAAAHAADIRAHLQRAGTPIGSYDTLIAGHARSRGLILLSGNLSEFRRVPGLLSEDWTDEA
jgi:tRNA(fMet)-specific endonuclease VapC